MSEIRFDCIPPPLPPPPPGRPSLHCFARQYLLRWFVLTICQIHFLALLSHHFSHLCVFFNILSPKAVYRVLYCFFRPKMFSTGDRVWLHSRTLDAHVLATVVGPSPNGPQFCHIRYIRPGGVTQVDHERSIPKAGGHGSCITHVSRVAGDYPHVFGTQNTRTAHTAHCGGKLELQACSPHWMLS